MLQSCVARIKPAAATAAKDKAKSPDAKTPEDAAGEQQAKPAHHLPNGKFTNPWPSFKMQGFAKFLKSRLTEWEKVIIPPPAERPRVVQTKWEMINAPPPANQIQSTWIGHASFLVQFDGVNILTDPIFSERCSAVQWAGPKRIIPVPFPAQQLPPIDLVIISHNHYDHLDTNTVRNLKDKVHRWAVPLGLKKWLVDTGVHADAIVELDWWEEFSLDLNQLPKNLKPEDEGQDDGLRLQKILRVVCTPCQHFSGRAVYDNMTTLWASWTLIGPSQRFWFAGDTGYKTVPKGVAREEEEKLELPVCPAFKEIGQKFGPFDLCAIPIGAFSPRHFMSAVHLNPEDAVDVHLDVRSKQSIGMHWGTFILTDEQIWEPPKQLKAALERRGLPSEVFVTLDAGETFVTQR